MQLTKAIQKELRGLLTRHGRGKSSKIVVEGIRAIQTMLQNRFLPEYVVISPDHMTRSGRDFLAHLDFGGAPVYETEPQLFETLADTVRSQGLLAVVEWPGYAGQVESILKKARFVLYLDGIADPGNLGTIIRTAAAFDVDLVALSPQSVEISNPKVVRASAGLLFALPVEKVREPEPFFDLLQSNKIEIYGTAADATTDIRSLGGIRRICLAIGSEASGLGDAVRRRCRMLVAVKTAAEIESLNVAAATAIAINTIAGKLEV